MNAPAFIPVRVPTTVDDTAITGAELRIHPADLHELWNHWRFCWPGNAKRDEFNGTRLIEDVEAPLLPRRRL